jgi:hypothetical protein
MEGFLQIIKRTVRAKQSEKINLSIYQPLSADSYNRLLGCKGEKNEIFRDYKNKRI